jgi:hypothetical protein
MNESEPKGRLGNLNQEQWDEIAKIIGPRLVESGPGWLGCLGFCYDIEVTFKEANAKILSMDPQPPWGTGTLVNKALEAAIQALAQLKFPSKHWQKKCADEEECDCWLLVGPGETDFKVPTLRKKKTFTVHIPGLGDYAFTIEFELTVTIHVKGEFGVCTDGVI